MAKKISNGTVHEIPSDVRRALISDGVARAAWDSLTSLSRNEWICWVISVKKDLTRKEHVERLVSELKEGVRRPCCWMGCTHRTDKPVSRSVQALLERRPKKSIRHMKTLKCDLCEATAEGETFEEWMKALMPHYMQVHADVMNDPKNGKEEQKKWMIENRTRFEIAP